MIEIKQLLEITKSLREKYGNHERNFTLDGKLVGDIGEVLVAEKYGIKLSSENTHIHDGEEIATGRMVQIKSSMRNGSYFPTNHTPDYIICVKIYPDGEVEELFNGPGQFIVDHYINKRKLSSEYRYPLRPLSGKILRELNKAVNTLDKIKPLL